MARATHRGRLSERVAKARSPIHGLGCFAKVSFLAGDYIGTYEGREVDADGTYVLWIYDADGQVLSAREGCNLLRWLNHSDDPNAELDLYRLYARRDIAPGDEITIDYGGGSPGRSVEEPPPS